MLSPIILQFLPFSFLVIFFIVCQRRRRLTPIPIVIAIVFITAIITAMGFFPEDLNFDKPRYSSMYMALLNVDLVSPNYKDMAWPYYVYYCGKIFGREIDLYFLFTATLYVSGYIIYARNHIKPEYLGYFFVFSAGCLGFSAYGVNTIRSGIALSLLLSSITIYDSYNLKAKYKSKKRIIPFIILCVISVLVHKSMLIPIIAYLFAINVKKLKWCAAFWLLCFLLSTLNFDLGEVFEIVGFVDKRVDTYIETLDSDSNYKTGYRIDFVIYSLVPLLIAWYYNRKKKIFDDSLLILFKMYLLSNAIWLLAIRIAYSDRLAYLSWFLIPIMLLVPICNNQEKFKNPQRMLLFVMAIFMVVPVLLFLRKS